VGSIRCEKRENEPPAGREIKAGPAGEIGRIRPIGPIRPIGGPRYIPSMCLLALDTGSPLVSVALARDGAVVAARSVEQERSSTRLLEMVREVLDEAGIGAGGLGALAVLRGPGSFTGLRIGLATVLGLHQALGIPATALPSLQVLALAAALSGTIGGRVIAAVDALRGDWSAQAFEDGHPLGEMELVPGPELPRLAGEREALVTGFGVSRLREVPGWPADLRLLEPGPLAPAAAVLASSPGTVWDPALLTAAIYSRLPAVTLPKPRVPALT
jgi:tRNA threonylcarbamoyladenosine biosynthesis protein TsaB